MMTHPGRTAGSGRWLDDDQVDAHDRARQPPPVWQGATLDQPSDGRSQLASFPSVERLLGEAEVPARPPADLHQHDHRRWARVERHDVHLGPAEPDVPAGDGPAQPDQVIRDQRLGGVTRPLAGGPPARGARVRPGVGARWMGIGARSIGVGTRSTPSGRRSCLILHPPNLTRPAQPALTGARGDDPRSGLGARTRRPIVRARPVRSVEARRRRRVAYFGPGAQAPTRTTEHAPPERQARIALTASGSRLSSPSPCSGRTSPTVVVAHARRSGSEEARHCG